MREGKGGMMMRVGSGKHSGDDDGGGGAVGMLSRRRFLCFGLPFSLLSPPLFPLFPHSHSFLLRRRC